MNKLKESLKLFLSFFKIGLFTFGGGYAMVSIIENEFVTKKKILTEDEFMKILTVAESTPGPIAVNSATYIGYRKTGFLGSLFCTLGVVLPSFIIILAISLFLDGFMQYDIVNKAFQGIQCGVGVLIISAGIKMFKKMEKTVFTVLSFIITCLLMLAINLFSVKFSTVYLVLIGLASGLFVTALSNRKELKNDDIS